MTELPRRKPTAMDVLSAHVEARGERVESMDEANAAYMATNLDMEAVMALAAPPPRTVPGMHVEAEPNRPSPSF